MSKVIHQKQKQMNELNSESCRAMGDKTEDRNLLIICYFINLCW